ncbi:short-chain dehydrogenase/reductase [Lactobacillus nasalidis]|uniref:Short-chain dehydrogenase/reductase n=1 Tax=Lactobacillus nasalidis TaxID=2797258 RepID=A0ABQ3WA75_9LACO|nr:SDR family NAD(P)-dependent oxidoreductase [Lactobacillus nasalidis]GHV98288.1 short-chain dehydrogenase/reductase [Lactobacillus nasalidis]GHV99413.1 short-chain dehydrogenase/reductase [Lactobacillus nasalidis]GHW01989.1 short-chain dehydrogenase/reductase [Lactobacillus nasalidis]
MKTWMITGTSSGFGKALASKLAQEEGVNVIATARKEADLDYLDQYDHGQIKKIIVDVSDPQAVKRAAAEALAFSSKIDVLVNNAGLGYFSTIEESDLKEVRYMFEVDFFGLAEMTEALLPQFRANKSGIIVNISSALGLTTLPTMGYYSAAKFAVEGYSDALRQEVADLGIKVLTVEPSGARTNWAGSSSEKKVPEIADYAKFKNMVATTDQAVDNAPGDPALIAQAIIDAVNSDKMPDHLPLGEFAYNGSLDKLRKLAGEIESNRAISLSTDDK